MGIVMEKIEPKRLVIQPDHHNYTLGGTAQYYAEIAILSANGYVNTEYDVLDRNGDPLKIAVLHLLDAAVKVYEL